ncbi:zeta toxin family protein [Blastopirellula sp. J2-11]|uniref:AAA family ATPase n=1 Tax=Blastopirellula sp. J2-11 TaxID=2943192 RepID=UPI0021C5CE0B|nr:zeta toxin family protein [Blastopirellula sp. J2-11]UUO07406.1 zeta toxin family protein [Blastopirellula sp. J2-11]
MMQAPSVIVIAGPNGAGKSTLAPYLLRDHLRVREFVNADVIAQGLSAYAPEGAAFEAGRIMLARLHELAAMRKSFALETTLASRSYARWLKELKTSGFESHLVFVWLPDEETAIERVAARVARGGHNIPEGTIRRRYQSGLKNLFNLYMPIVDGWDIINGLSASSDSIASGNQFGKINIQAEEIWRTIQHQATI